MTTQTLPSKVWTTLSAINVNEHVEKKNGLTYLSWAWAYKILMDHYPNNHYEFREESFENGQMMVHCFLTITEGEETFSRYMWLPVLDFKNKPVTNPDVFQINATRMRALTKCISQCGLGAYIYAGEDLPQAEVEAKNQPITTEQFELLMEGIAHAGIDLAKFTAHYKVSKLNELPAGLFDHAMGAVKNRIASNAAAELD